MTWLRSRRRERALILGYHRVGSGPDPFGLSLSEALFERHVDVITRFARAVPLSELVERVRTGVPPGQGSVVLTFDDAYALTLRRIEPLLRRHRVPATVFVPTALLGTEPWWDRLARTLSTRTMLPTEISIPIGTEIDFRRRLSADERRPGTTSGLRSRLIIDIFRALRSLSEQARARALDALEAVCGRTEPCEETRVASADEIAAIDRSDWFEIGSHSVTHPVLPVLGAEEQRAEVDDSRGALEGILGHRVELFSYPNGARDADTDRVVRDAGYRAACASEPGVVTSRSHPFSLPRFWPQASPEALERMIRRWL